MTEHTYTILLDPRGKGRPVFTRATGHARTPETTRSWEHEAAHQLREQHGDAGMLDSLSPMWGVRISAFHPRPKTRPGYLPRALWAVADYDLPATSRHDLDNVVKIVLDALQVGGVILNDRCIVAIDAASWFASHGQRGRVEVTLTEVTP